MELGRVDIFVEVSMLSSYIALLQEGHLEQLFHIFAHLKKHANYEMVFNPSEVDFDRKLFLRKE